MIPTLVTDRLILRGPVESDFEAHAAFFTHENSRWIGGPAPDRFTAWKGFLAQIGHWALRGYGLWVIAQKDTNMPIGRVGFMFSEGWDEPELGWHIYPDWEGKGLAYEAALAARTYGPNFGLNGVISYINPENTRSLALANRLGATIEDERMFLGKPALVHRHPKVAGSR